jgi:predicted ribosomally synthesized peptide with nif11-like leader
VSLQQLDAFLAFARSDAELSLRLKQPMDLADLLALADQAGYQVEEVDVIAAMVREDDKLSDRDLQRRAAEEARKLRNFIPG